MTTKIKITDSLTFSRLITNVDFIDLVFEGKGVFGGGVCLYTTDDKVVPFHGLIREDDFEKEFGFLIISD